MRACVCVCKEVDKKIKPGHRLRPVLRVFLVALSFETVSLVTSRNYSLSKTHANFRYSRAFQFAIRIDSIRYANRFESIRFVKNQPSDSLVVMQLLH